MSFKNESKCSLKTPNEAAEFTAFGRQFQSLAALTLKNWSYDELILITDDGILATLTLSNIFLIHQQFH